MFVVLASMVYLTFSRSRKSKTMRSVKRVHILFPSTRISAVPLLARILSSSALSAVAATNMTTGVSQSQLSNPPTTKKEPPAPSGNPLFSPRKHTVISLWELVQLYRVVHVRGTPSSGKTVLAELLQAHVETSTDVQVYFITWIPTDFSNKGYDASSDHNELLDCATKRQMPLGDWRNAINTLLLIDEAQLSYKYIHMWNDFIKYLCGAGYGPLVVLISSYGSPSASPIHEAPDSLPPPFLSSDTQRLSIRPLSDNNPAISLHFTR